MSKFTKLLVITALSLSVGCSFKKDNSHSPPAQQDVVETLKKDQEKQAFEGQLTESNVSIKFDEIDAPGAYKMLISWPNQISRMQVVINNGSPDIITGKSTFTIPVSQNTQQMIDLLAYDSLGAPISSLRLIKSAPKDFLIDSTVSLSADTTLDGNRLFITEKGLILTNGFNLSINVNKITLSQKEFTGMGMPTDNGHIVTSFLNLPATKLEQLRGSSISINAKIAIGHLHVFLIGANGQNGRDGREMENATSNIQTSLNGTNGSDGQSFLPLRPCFKGNKDAPCDPVASYVCKKAPTNGEDGKAGPQGADGEDGWNGGDTGSISVVVQDYSQFSLEITQKRGSPGKGGQGAPGKDGGKGGLAGKSAEGCPIAKNGNNGPRGKNGNAGHDGTFGKNGSVITSVSNTKVNEL